MRFSIITPVYNASSYLAASIHSILSQTVTDFEWICVDDGSTDDSLEILQNVAAKDSRIHIIHQDNGGVSKARNTALSNAQGEWICFLDADDELTPYWLQSYEEAITEEVDIVFSGAIIKTNDGETKYQLPAHDILSLSETVKLWQDHHQDMGSAWSKCIRHSVILENNAHFSENINNFEDWIFLTYVLSSVRKTKTIPFTDYIYNRQNSTLTAAGQKRRSAEATYAIATEWYRAIQSLQGKSKTGYYRLITANSNLQTQTIMEVYRRKDIPRQERHRILKELSFYDFHPKHQKISQRMTRWLYFPNFIVFSDLLLRVWRFAK